MKCCARASGSGSAGGGAGLPECNGSGTGHADGRCHEVQPELSALQGTGQVCERLSGLPRRGRARAPDQVEVRIPPGRSTGEPAARRRARAMPGRRRPPGDLYITVHVEPHPFFQRDGDDIHIQSAHHGVGSRSGRQDRSAHHRWARAVEDPAGHSERAALPACARRASSTPAREPRGDQIVEVAFIQAPKVQTSARANCCASWPRSILKIPAPEDPRAELWAQTP
jgi:molecular chaperone DnaJ